ncbi:CDP-alcohol phosphatidyltransferase family protein [Bowdeniella massiliensis]|uniref:CDP-alcohol phosphatidyltransferase family protein n=1 Tax=Bowdeniella massiliensis TaxID=2932264 RepID=UPI002028E738|nr:CDP-alcohol phosphatidyltransferase family protein [Bowdeniella massiliensis]
MTAASPGGADGSVWRNARSANYPQLSLKQRLAVWSVHGFTMTGVIWACLATISLAHGRILQMWGWLAIALLVDALDGTFARRADVKNRVPWFDGSILDNIVDFITWTFLPAIFMYLHVDFGAKWIAMIMMILVCVSSTFCYCNTQVKAHDQYFVGFPAAWNIVAAYFWLLQTGPVINVLVTVLFAALTVSNLTFLHPLRVRALMVPNLIAVSIWFICLIWLMVGFPARPAAIWLAFWISGIWFIGVGVWRTFKGTARNQGR